MVGFSPMMYFYIALYFIQWLNTLAGVRPRIINKNGCVWGGGAGFVFVAMWGSGLLSPQRRVLFGIAFLSPVSHNRGAGNPAS